MPQARARTPKYYVGFAGQSLNYAPQQPLGGANDYNHQLMAHYPNCTSSNDPVNAHIAQSGTAWATLLLSAPFKVQPRGKGAPTCILIMQGGTSDYASGTSGADVYQICSDYADLARTYGFDIVIFTTTTPSQVITTAGYEANRVAGNAACMADLNSKFDYKLDIAAATGLNDFSDPLYYGDTLHWTTLGATTMANLVKPTLDSIIPVADR